MSFLIFCTYEPGGWPYAMADVLNRNGNTTYYVSLARAHGHDSTAFHFGADSAPWNLSAEVCRPFSRVAHLRNVVSRLGVDGCLATGTRAYLAATAGCTYRYWSYGSDLDQACFWPTKPQRQPGQSNWRSYAYYCYRLLELRRARRSIRAAESVMIAPYQHATLLAVKPKARMFFLPQLVRTETLERTLDRKRAATRRMTSRFGVSDIFFSATRHVWGPSWIGVADNKGNDVIVRAFAHYVSNIKGNKPKLLLIKKGQSVELTQRLISELQVSKYVVWLDEMSRDELREFYLGATVCFGQFGTPVHAFTTLEPLACATPTISYIADTFHRRVPTYKLEPPLCNTRDPVKAATFLRSVVESESVANDFSRRGWEWVHTNCSERAFCDAFVAAMAKKQPVKR